MDLRTYGSASQSLFHRRLTDAHYRMQLSGCTIARVEW
jgi:hypothetical protein